MNNLEMKDTIDIDHIYFEGFTYDALEDKHVVFWGS